MGKQDTRRELHMQFLFSCSATLNPSTGEGKKQGHANFPLEI